jgi:hypothetical protein
MLITSSRCAREALLIKVSLQNGWDTPASSQAATNPPSVPSDHWHTNTEHLFATRVWSLDSTEVVRRALGLFIGSPITLCTR